MDSAVSVVCPEVCPLRASRTSRAAWFRSMASCMPSSRGWDVPGRGLHVCVARVLVQPPGVHVLAPPRQAGVHANDLQGAII
jgi:hypothetical protein